MSKCIYQIRVPEEQDAEAFVKFMREEYFPAAYRWYGFSYERRTPFSITGIALLQRLEYPQEAPDAHEAHEFYLHVDWDATGCPDPSDAPFVREDEDEVLRKLESFGARLDPLGAYRAYRGHGGVEG